MTLVKKLSIAFFAVMLTAYGLLNLIVPKVIEENCNLLINKDMMELRENCETFIRREYTFMELYPTEENFESLAKSIADNLREVLGKEVAFFSSVGDLIYSTFSQLTLPLDDIKTALSVYKSTYTIFEDEGQVFVYFSFPVYSGDSILGIVRLLSDYTDMYKNLNYMWQTLNSTTASIILVALALTTLFVSRIIRPMKKLRKAIADISKEPSLAEPIKVSRKDEIGQLTQEYNNMAATIKTQMNTILLEQENLHRTIKYRKDFYDNMTHELKTPLTIILGYSEMMAQTDFKDINFCRMGITQIVNESQRLKDMVAGLLETSRASGTPTALPESVDLEALLLELTASMALKAERYGLKITTELKPGVTVITDAEKLRQLLVNLLDNAIKYGVPTTGVEVSLTEEEAVRISIKNGCYELIEDVESLFVPFHQRGGTNKEPGSVGLGLSICKNIADAIGGSLTVDVSESEKIAFCLELQSSEGINQYEKASDTSDTTFCTNDSVCISTTKNDSTRE